MTARSVDVNVPRFVSALTFQVALKIDFHPLGCRKFSMLDLYVEVACLQRLAPLWLGHTPLGAIRMQEVMKAPKLFPLPPKKEPGNRIWVVQVLLYTRTAEEIREFNGDAYTVTNEGLCLTIPLPSPMGYTEIRRMLHLLGWSRGWEIMDARCFPASELPDESDRF